MNKGAEMDKFEFSDLYKFLVSIGIILIGGAWFMNYAFFSTDFGVFISAEEFENLRKPAQDIIIDKENYVNYTINVLSFGSLFMIAAGLIMTGIGLVKWNKRQRVLDDMIDTELRLKQYNVDEFAVKMSLEERKNELIAEVNSIQVVPPENLDEDKGELIESITSETIRVEEEIISKIEGLRSRNFELHSQLKIDNRYRVDLLMKAKTRKYSDRLIEIKNIGRASNPVQIASLAVEQLSSFVRYYYLNINNLVLPVLILVVKDYNIEEIQSLEYSTMLEFNRLLPDRRVKLFIMNDKEIDSFDPKLILKR